MAGPAHERKSAGATESHGQETVTIVLRLLLPVVPFEEHAMTFIKAHYDGRVFVPDSPVNLPPGYELEIAVPSDRSEDNGGNSPLKELADSLRELPPNPHRVGYFWIRPGSAAFRLSVAHALSVKERDRRTWPGTIWMCRFSVRKLSRIT